jgi:hypothetical protein
MQTVRRVYLYLVSAVSLIGVSWAVIGLARLIISEGIGQGQIIGLASWLAVIIVGLPIFLFHWLMAQRLADQDPEERGSIIRRIFLYGILAAGAAPIISNIYRLVDNTLLTLLGGSRPDYYPYDLTIGEHLVALLIWGVIWIYVWWQIQTDNRLIMSQLASNKRGQAHPVAGRDDWGGVRRIYLLAFSLAGLVMVTWGAIALLQLLMQLPAEVVWRSPIANNSARLLVGAAVWAIHWLRLQQLFFSGSVAEERSVLRKVYLYLAVLVYSVMAVGSATMLLKRLMELALGAPPAEEPLLSQLSGPVPLMIVGAIFWAYHWQVLRQDAQQAPEAPRQAGVRRIYAYLVAAIGLSVLLVGIGGLLSIVVDLLTTPAAVGLSYYREQVALFSAMTVVGVPVWLIPWRTMQGVALTPPGAGTAGEEERRSTIRKIYLYLFVFVAAIAVFSSVGWFVFHILTAILGADLPNDFITLVLDALVIALLASGVWFYHWWAIRQDGQLQQQDQARRLSDISVVVIDGNEGKLGQTIIRQLQHDLPGLQLNPIGLTPQATTAMAAQPFSTALAGVMDTAHYIIGPWQSLLAAEVAPAVAASPAQKLAVPTPNPNWIWAGVRSRALDYYAHQAALGVKQAIDGEEITPSREIDLITVLAIIGGILIFLLIAGGLLGFVLSML